MRWRTRRTLYANLSKLLVILDKLTIELGPWPGNWCQDAIRELEWVLSIQKFGPIQDEDVPYTTTTEIWMKNMFQIEEEWVKKGKEWNISVTRKDKLTTNLTEEIRKARFDFEEEEERLRRNDSIVSSNESS